MQSLQIQLTTSNTENNILFPLTNSQSEADIKEVFNNNNQYHVFAVADGLVQHKTIQCSDGYISYSPFFSLPPTKRIWLVQHGWPLSSLVSGEYKIERRYGRRDSIVSLVNDVNSCYLLHYSETRDLRQSVYSVAYDGMYNSHSIRGLLQATALPIFNEKMLLNKIEMLLHTFLLCMHRFYIKLSGPHLPSELKLIIMNIYCSQSLSNGNKITFSQLLNKSTSLLRTPLAQLPGVMIATTLTEHTNALEKAIAPSKEDFEAMRY